MPSSHSLSTAASRCILLVHANSSVCAIVHAAYNAFINVDDQMDFRLYRLMYRLYLASSPRTTISVWALHWVAPSENAWFVVRSEVLRMRKLPIRPCPLIALLFATFDAAPFDRRLLYLYTYIHIYIFFFSRSAMATSIRRVSTTALRDVCFPTLPFVRIELESSQCFWTSRYMNAPLCCEPSAHHLFRWHAGVPWKLLY